MSLFASSTAKTLYGAEDVQRRDDRSIAYSHVRVVLGSSVKTAPRRGPSGPLPVVGLVGGSVVCLLYRRT
jgi:hypothetical protein